ncbi:hypothetical protein CROQUDRAFT_278893 [Cronartium quercuum f. sp. fusiforme G11]|uniref:Ras-domain-containing protein n=1 Tax=Cronartium quercuum f. sp. fusiforme G11 TaxID=708437 RepID=A0A9P6NUU3_9BASI|nr:hypothetical protein CROQUDRAFT_278893 [Cronartium quercuum f. sp. fusiforme G11]
MSSSSNPHQNSLEPDQTINPSSSRLYQSFPRQPNYRNSKLSPSSVTPEPSSPGQTYAGLLNSSTTTSLTLHHELPTALSLEKPPALAAAALAELIHAHPPPTPDQSPPQPPIIGRQSRYSLPPVLSPIGPPPSPNSPIPNGSSTTNSNSTSTSSFSASHTHNHNHSLAHSRAGPSRSNTLAVPTGTARGGRVQPNNTSPSPSRETGSSSTSSAPAQTPTGQLEAKVVILGMQGVGKTSIVHRYTTGSFSYSLASTIGASFCTKKLSVDGCKVRLQIWDTAGQERFRSMAPMYYRGANAAILVYDITNQASFDDIQNWLDELRENMSPELIIQIVGSKSDLALNRREVNLDLAYQQILNWTEPFPFRVWPQLAITEVSAKDDFGIEDMFLVLTRRLVTRKAEIEELRLRRSRESIILEPLPSSNNDDSGSSWCC